MLICPVVLLVAVHVNGHEVRPLEPLQLPLHRAASRAGEFHDLGHVEASIGLAEQQTEYPLLR